MRLLNFARNLIKSRSLGAGQKLAFLGILFKGSVGREGTLHKLRLDRGHVLIDPKHMPDVRVFYDIFVLGEYNTDYRDTYVADLGAHKAYATAYAINRGARFVVAYEPDPQNFLIAQRTIASLGTDRAQISQAAVTGHTGHVEFHSTDQSWSHSVLPRSDRTAAKTVTVSTLGLQEIIEDLIRKRDLDTRSPAARVILLMDIEGSECDAILETDVDMLAQVDEMFLELHTFAVQDVPAVITKLQSAGFEVEQGEWEVPDTQHVVLHLKQRRANSELLAHSAEKNAALPVGVHGSDIA